MQYVYFSLRIKIEQLIIIILILFEGITFIKYILIPIHADIGHCNLVCRKTIHLQKLLYIIFITITLYIIYVIHRYITTK